MNTGTEENSVSRQISKTFNTERTFSLRLSPLGHSSPAAPAVTVVTGESVGFDPQTPVLLTASRTGVSSLL